MVVRAHETVGTGFASFGDGNMVTVFSAPDYQGYGNTGQLCKMPIQFFLNKWAILIFCHCIPLLMIERYPVLLLWSSLLAQP